MSKLSGILKKYSLLWFIFTLLIVSFYYNYHHILTLRPVGIHQWRNTISASYAQNYYHEGDFFHPRTHGLLAEEGSSDVAVSEFPIMYYFIAQLYKLFGFNETIYRLVNVLIGFAGLIFLYLFCRKRIGNNLLSFVIPLFVFTSPIYVFYTNNFITDATALSLALIGLYYLGEYYHEQNSKYIRWFLFWLVMAGLFKTPSLLIYFAVLAILIIQHVFKRLEMLPNRHLKRNYLWFLLSFVIMAAWYAYAKIYTDAHGGGVSAVEIRPFWIIGNKTIGLTLEAMKMRFLNGNYHQPVFLIVSLLLTVLNIIFFRRYNRFYSLLMLFTFIGGISFTVLFFRSMRHHDYYQINNLMIIALIYISLGFYIKNNKPNWFRTYWFNGILAAGTLFLVIECKQFIDKRYSDYHHYSSNKNVHRYGHIRGYLDSLGISRYDTVYVTPDRSLGINLYLMDQKGYTDVMVPKGDINKRIEYVGEKSADYVIIGDTSEVNIDRINPDLAQKIGEKNGVFVFKLNRINKLNPW